MQEHQWFGALIGGGFLGKFCHPVIPWRTPAGSTPALARPTRPRGVSTLPARWLLPGGRPCACTCGAFAVVRGRNSAYDPRDCQQRFHWRSMDEQPNPHGSEDLVPSNPPSEGWPKTLPATANLPPDSTLYDGPPDRWCRVVKADGERCRGTRLKA